MITGEVPTSIQDEQTVFTHLEVDKRGYRGVVGKHDSEFTDELILTDNGEIQWDTSVPGVVTARCLRAESVNVNGILGDILFSQLQDIPVQTVLGNPLGSASFPIPVDVASLSLRISGGSLQLDGDQASPGNSMLYGTDSGGTKGWFAQPTFTDPWTVVTLGSQFTTTNATDTNVTGLNFTPSASTTYAVTGMLMLRSTSATVGTRPGIAWSNAGIGGSSAGFMYSSESSGGAFTFRQWDGTTTQNVPLANVPTVNVSFFAKFDAIIRVGTSPSGNFQITVASETAGTTVSVEAGSFLMYRVI